MKITITLEDDEKGQVQVEEVRQLTDGENQVTAASVLAEEMLAILDALGDTESASKSH